MKILRIVPSGYEEGGIENGIVLMQPLLTQRGHIVKTFASDARPDLPHFNDFFYKTPPNNFKGKFFYSFNLDAYRSLKAALEDFKPDVVHIHAIGSASPLILFALKSYPTVFSIHGPEAFIKQLRIWCFPLSYFKHNEYVEQELTLAGKLRFYYQEYFEGLIYFFGLLNVDVFVTLSKYMNKLMSSEGYQNVYVPNATNLFDYRPLSNKKIASTIVYAGRLKKFKGVNYLIEAMPAILKKFPAAKLLIAGDGDERDHLQQFANELGIEKQVSFLGHLNRLEMEKLYGQATTVVIPSVWPEAFGKIGIEAMSVGRTVIATNVGGISDWLSDGKNGIMILPRDSDSIAKAVIDLFSHPSKLIQMGKNAREKSEEFELSIHAKNMEAIYLRAIQLHKKKLNSES